VIVPLPCGPSYFDGCTCTSCSQYRNEAWAGRVPKLDRAQLEARIAHARELGELEPLKPAPKVSWASCSGTWRTSSSKPSSLPLPQPSPLRADARGPR
jgi:hypothetical protein